MSNKKTKGLSLPEGLFFENLGKVDLSGITCMLPDDISFGDDKTSFTIGIGSSIIDDKGRSLYVDEIDEDEGTIFCSDKYGEVYRLTLNNINHIDNEL